MNTQQLQVSHCERILRQTSDWGGGYIVRWSKDFRSEIAEKKLHAVEAEVFRIIGHDTADGTLVFDQVEIIQNEKVEKKDELDYEIPILRFSQEWHGGSSVWFAHHLRCCYPHVMLELADVIRHITVTAAKMLEGDKDASVGLPKNDLQYNPPTPFTPRPMSDGIQRLPSNWKERLAFPYRKWMTTCQF